MTSAGNKPRADRQTLYAIRCATMIRDQELWPDSEVADARHMLQAQFRREPTLEELAARYGAEVVSAAVEEVLSNRRAEIMEAEARRLAQIKDEAERHGQDSPCHLCQSPRTEHDPSYEFGLAQILEDKAEWGTAGAALALNLLTLPFGVAVGAGPGRSTRARIARCRLVLCAACGKRRGRFFGGLNVTEADCSKHPSWGRLMAAGLNSFLDEKQLSRFRQ